MTPSNPALDYLAAIPWEPTRATMKQALLAIARATRAETIEDADWGAILNHASAFRQTPGVAPATINLRLIALRGVLKRARRLGIISRDLADDIEADLAPVRGDGRKPKGRCLTEAEVASLFAACDLKLYSGQRDAALLAVAVFGGLRRAEIAGLRVADYDKKTGKLSVLGKGRKLRVIPLPAPAREALERWLQAVPGGFWDKRGEVDRIFGAFGRNDVASSRPLSKEGVGQVLKRLCQLAGIKGTVTPHDFRRTYASSLLDIGVDLPTVMGLMGHASPTTTVRYDRRDDGTKERAVDALATKFGG